MFVNGAVTQLDANVIAGWVAGSDELSGPLHIDIRYRGVVISSGAAEQNPAGGGNDETDHRFFFQLPMPTFLPQSERRELEAWLRDPSQRLSNYSDAYEGLPQGFPSRSLFGGLWSDRPDWMNELNARRAAGDVSEELAGLIESFATNGFVVIKRAVEAELVDKLNAEIERFWDAPPTGLLIETFEPDSVLHYVQPNKEFRAGRTKLLDLYAFSSLAREAISTPRIVEFLTAIFESKPKAIQGLAFWTGSEQALHKDSAYVKIDTAPMNLVASWLALEDISVGTGELEYYVGSHQAPEFLFGGSHKWLENNPGEHDSFLASIHEDARVYGYGRASFNARKGDVLIWHADLAHGGASIVNREMTRKSLVTHFTSMVDEPYYRRYNSHKVFETRDCGFVSNYADVPAAGS